MDKRDTIFICHANPDDNELTKWLCTHLAQLGYKVWSDVTRFFGGDWMWPEIENQIRNNTVKVLFVSSQASNKTDGGCMRELTVADSVRSEHKHLKRFIVPLKTKSISHGQSNIFVNGHYALPFDISWTKGFAELINVLEEDNVPKSIEFNPSFVANWWRNEFEFSSSKALIQKPEQYISNWFPITHLPKLYFHTLRRSTIGSIQFPEHSPYPFVAVSGGLLTFALAEEFKECLPYNHDIGETYSTDILDPNSANPIIEILGSETNRLLVQLLKSVVSLKLKSTNLLSYNLSKGEKCFYFSYAEGSKRIKTIGGIADASRQLAGIYHGTEYWHYAIQLKPWMHSKPILGIKSHIVFSSDGITAWDSSAKQHRARRSYCKMWFNQKWRDLILVAVSYLGTEKQSILFPVNSSESLTVSIIPINFTVPVSYLYGEDFESQIVETYDLDEFEEEALDDEI